MESKIPKDWTTKQIKEVALIKGGKRLPKGSKLLQEKTEYPYIRVADFTNEGTISLDKIQYLTKKDQNIIKNYIIKVEDLYISIAGTIGKTGIIPKELDGANLTENAARLVFKDKTEISNKYVYYYTLSSFFIKQSGIATKTVAQPKLALTRLGEILIPFPQLIEQKRILVKLDSLFERIDKAIQLVEENIVNAERLMGSVLDEVFNSCKGKYTAIKISEFSKTKSGGTPNRGVDRYWGGEIVWLKSGELDDNLFITENSEFITEEGLKSSSATLFNKGTLLMAMYGATAGKLGILGMDATTNQAVCSIQNTMNKFNPLFLFFYLYSIRNKILEDSTGGAQPNISKGYIDELEVPLPSLKKQEEYVVTFLKLDQTKKEIISKQKEKLLLLEQLKSSLLDSAFKGEL